MGDNMEKNIEIGVFGDSIAKGIVLRQGSEHYELSGVDVEKAIGRGHFHLQNFSMMGCTILKGLSMVRRQIKKIKDCKSVFLEFGGNDCDMDWKAISENPSIEHGPKTPLEDFIKLYTQVVEELRKNGNRPIMLTLPPLDPERYFAWVSRKLDKERILSWLGGVDTIYRWQELYNLQVLMLAAKLSVPIIDIRGMLLSKRNYKNFICTDGIHPNREGYELIYRTIAEQYDKNI